MPPKPQPVSPQDELSDQSPRTENEIVDEASEDSFPASDPPAHTPTSGAGPVESHDQAPGVVGPTTATPAVGQRR